MDDCESLYITLVIMQALTSAYSGWHAPSRDSKTGAPVADPNKFPNGVKDLSDKIHDMGLKVIDTHIYIHHIDYCAFLVWYIQRCWSVCLPFPARLFDG